VGPEVSDVVLCRDVIHRLCIAPRCSSMSVLNVDNSCEQVLQQRTGCDQEEFVFTAPSRDRVLECRLPLVRAGNETVQHPDCLDVDHTLNECTDLTRFLQGVQ
jgi:hypothetical protein